MKIQRKTQKIILSSFFIFLTIIIVLFLVLEILNLNKIILGLRIADVKIGGSTTEEAEIILAKHFEKWEKQPLILVYDSQQIIFEPSEIGISLDLKKTLTSAYNTGREENILAGLYQQSSIILGLGQANILPAFSFDEEAFEKFTDQKFLNLENPARNASLQYNNKTKNWSIINAQEGEIFDRELLKQDLINRIENLDSSAIDLTLIKDEPEVLENETQKARLIADRILSYVPYYFQYADQKQQKIWKIDKETLIDWLEFTAVEESSVASDKNKILGVILDREKVKDVLVTIAPDINQEPVNAQLTLKDDRVTAFALSREGIELEIEKTADKTIDFILHFGQDQIDQSYLDKKIQVAATITQPKITTNSIDTLGLTSLVGKGTSNFAGSPKNRVHNIKVGTAKFDGILLEPGQEFSFNAFLGQIGPAQGYLPELVIKSNKTIPEYGGGICQVSTTAFRAAVNAGLKVIERYPHAFPVKYYDPQGFDATIYPPHPDLRFINDTPSNLLIQARVEGSQLIFEFFGTYDGRQIKVIGPTILDSKADGSMKTILYQEIWRDGELERKDKFYSNYRSPNLYPVIRNPLE